MFNVMNVMPAKGDGETYEVSVIDNCGNENTYSKVIQVDVCESHIILRDGRMVHFINSFCDFSVWDSSLGGD